MDRNDLNKYAGIAGEQVVEEILDLGSELSEKSLVHVNSTYYGGGVAEMLNSYVPLLNHAGLSTEWRLLKGNKEFFLITKKIHNALQGAKETLTEEEKMSFEQTIKLNSEFTNLKWYDCVIIDDPQPVPLITYYSRVSPSLWKPMPEFLGLKSFSKKQPWIWRCHIDLSKPNKATWNYLSKFLTHFNSVIISDEKFKTKLNKPHYIIPPAIDPLSDKNRELKEYEKKRALKCFDLDWDKPIISQISRFDAWKDPLGVITAFKKIRQKTDCQLVLLGSHASDDPESDEIYQKVVREAQKEKDVHIASIQSDILVNALQRESAVVIQKSLREGFGLTVSEALWKGTPVVGGNVGGIPRQIQNGKNGFLVNDVDECARKTLWLLKNPLLAQKAGEAGREWVRQNFLITRLVKDELQLVHDTVKSQLHVSPIRGMKTLLDKLAKTPQLITQTPKILEKLLK